MAIKAREIRERLGNKVDPDLLYVMCALAEQQSVMRHQLMELSQLVDKQTDIIRDLVSFSEVVGSVFEKMKDKEDSTDAGPVTE